MFKGNRFNYIVRFWLDMLVLLVCFALASYLDAGNIEDISSKPVITLFSISLVVWYFGARIFLLYGDITIFSYSQEMVVFMRQLATHLLLLIFVLFIFFDEFSQYRSRILYYHGFIFLAMPIEKFFYRLVTANVRAQYKYEKNILIVGAGTLAANFYRSNILNNNLKYNLVGVIDDHEHHNFNGRYLGKVNHLPELLSGRKIDEVFLALPNDESDKIEYVIDICEKHAKRVNVIQDITRIGSSRFNVTNYAGFPVVGIRYHPLDDPENRFFKRVFDIIFSALFLTLIYSWLYPIIAIVIKLNSKGPVMFKQERWGLNNKKIVCYKFRTMYVNGHTEENESFTQAKKNDTRVTSVGRFLRKTSLDEMPQFINVFLGSMSVVGPRPHPIPLSLESKDIIQNYMLRHLVKPGITGWAQVNGSRGETSQPDDMRKRVGFDLWYIENWTFWLDNQIILQTIINLIKGDENAY
jgi:putative colanic acid biosynthesis UDP-glucose lipid carrier transferase